MPPGLTLPDPHSQENAHTFLDAAATDEIMMLEGILKLQGSFPAAEAKLRATVERLKARRGDNVYWRPDYAAIASRVRVKQEYDAFWKLYSKYVYPSSWVVNGEVQEVRNPAYQQIFQMQAQFNAHRILTLVEANLEREAEP